jgi:hypothetical protein
MTTTDAFGYAVSVDDPQARAAWDACVTAFLAHDARTPLHLGIVLERAPDFAMAWAAKGMFYLLLGRRELRVTAEEALTQAREACAAGHATDRERAYVAALDKMLAGRMMDAARDMDAILARWPADTLALKLGHAIRFVMGDSQGMRASVEAALGGFGSDHPHAGYVAGCHAFALEETGDYAAAETRGRWGVERAPDDAWGLHAVAHVFDMTARADDGRRWLSADPQRWAHCNNFGLHVWWHLALFHLEHGGFDEALDLYDGKIRAEKTDDYRDIANAVSLLARLEAEGVDVGDRWQELAGLAARRIDDGCVVFADLHYLMALTHAGKHAEAARLVARIAADGARSSGDMAQVARDVGRPMADGLLAFAAGGYRTAYRRLSETRRILPRIGGSHAQRDVFAWVMIEAAMRGGLYAEAAAELDARARWRGAADGYTARRVAEIASVKALERSENVRMA